MPTFLLFVGLIIFLIVGLGVLLGSLDIKNIQAEWDKRRCDPSVMFSGFMYKPSDDPRSASTFAGDNFSFCMKSMVSDIFGVLLAPALQVFVQQMAAVETTNDVFNSIRNQVANAYRSFSSIFDDFFETYKRGTMQLSRITQLIQMAMLKVSASVVAIVYMGMALMTSLLNSYDFVVKVVIIIMTIMISMIVLLFFALMPFMPVIFTMIAVLTAAGFGGAVGGMGGAFCLHPDTLVLIKDMNIKPIKDIHIGDELFIGNPSITPGRVIGILETDVDGDLYNINGIIISASHQVLYNGKYILAKNHPEGFIVTENIPDKLIILNTEGRCIPVLDQNCTVLLVKDWEEIPDDNKILQIIWEKMVDEMLNGSLGEPLVEKPLVEKPLVEKPLVEKPNIHIPENVSLFSIRCSVIERNLGEISIGDVKRGQEILDINGSYTKIVGTYIGLYSGDGDLSDGVRMFTNGLWETTVKDTTVSDTTVKDSRGFNLITDTGTFQVKIDGNFISVRDFTEVGHENIHKTYDIVGNYLNM